MCLTPGKDWLHGEELAVMSAIPENRVSRKLGLNDTWIVIHLRAFRDFHGFFVKTF
jgi:hypothetical protein